MYPTTLGEILKLEYGKPLPQSDRKQNGRYPAYGANGVKAQTDKYFYDKPSIIVGRKGSAGELNLTTGKFWPLDVTYFVTHDDQVTDIQYLYYLLKMLNLPSMARGVKPGINRNDIYSIKVTIPPLNQQQKIVNKIEVTFKNIDEAIALAQSNMLSCKRLFETELERIFSVRAGSNTKLIQDICTIKGGKRLPKGKKLLTTQTPYPYIRVTDFDHRGSVNLNSVQYLSEDVHKLISNYVITDNDVFLSIAGSIGITGIIPSSLNGANLTENACRMIPNNLINKHYLYYFTLTRSFIEQAAGATRQTAQPKLALIRIKNIRINLPSLTIQETIVKNLGDLSQKVNALENLHQSQVKELQALRSTTLTKVFSGSVVK